MLEREEFQAIHAGDYDLYAKIVKERRRRTFMRELFLFLVLSILFFGPVVAAIAFMPPDMMKIFTNMPSLTGSGETGKLPT